MQNQLFRRAFLSPDFLFRMLLGTAWVLGLIIGYYFPFSDPDMIASLMRRLVVQPVSIVGVVACIGIPFTASILCYRYSAPYYLIAIAFLKAFLTGLCIAAIRLAFGDAAWLCRWLVAFSDSCISAPLLWYWYRCTGKGNRQDRLTGALIVIAIVICCVDSCFISQFSLSLF